MEAIGGFARKISWLVVVVVVVKALYLLNFGGAFFIFSDFFRSGFPKDFSISSLL